MQIEGLSERALAGWRDGNRPCPLDPPQPTLSDAAQIDGRSDRSRDVRTAFTPVETRAAEHAAATSASRSSDCLVKVDADFTQEIRAVLRQSAAIRREVNVTPSRHCIGDPDGKLPGEMVVASASAAQCLVARPDDDRLPRASTG